ncbi:hypothetical protein DFH08DRAFT_936603 [Mycena albidolilacea]|uniref:Uncharacterized protein n=1 Tax=Mycena albidolilacea TaxID=1033008 RepID=A0AAD7A2M5_9AGAR|nr:hypothetical protein DFH08DRAFT_936603 [Mycena albidolilacea]
MGTLRYIWAGDFNRHHPLWDKLCNQHLFTSKNLDLAQPLLDLLARYGMAMALPFLELEHTLLEHVPTPLYKKIHWEDYRNRLLKTLIGLERRDSYDTVESVMDAIRAVEDTVWTTTKAVAKFSKPSPHVKRWYTEEMRDLRRVHTHLERSTVRHTTHHWVEWQEKLLGSLVWDVHKFLSATLSDGSASRIPTLVKCQGGRQDIVTMAETDEEKCAWLRTEFFPPRMTVSSVPPDPVFPPPAWEWKPVSDDLLHRAAEKMKPYKATFPESIPNCVIKQWPIFRSLDKLNHFPDDWSELRIPVLRKPGKPDYNVPGAHQPIALTEGLPRPMSRQCF